MATKKDVSNAFYEGVCTLISTNPETLISDIQLNDIHLGELTDFVESQGDLYTHLFQWEDGQIVSTS